MTAPEKRDNVDKTTAPTDKTPAASSTIVSTSAIATADDPFQQTETAHEQVPLLQSCQTVDKTETLAATAIATAAATAETTTTTVMAASSSSPSPSTTPVLSKNQQKRQAKWAQAMAVKKRRKEQEKAIQRAKAAAEGRDIAADQLRMKRQQELGIGRAKREQKWKERFDRNSSKFTIAIDCSFEHLMTERECQSLGSQLRFCYSLNKNAKHPVQQVMASNLQETGTTMQYLQGVAGFDQWKQRAWAHSSSDLAELFPLDKCVYLTSDSDHVLETLQDNYIYIIGGIVDRNRLKRLTVDRAESLGMATAKLPIAEHLKLTGTKVLTVNHVFELLVRLREFDMDWKQTLLAVLPERKQGQDRDGCADDTASKQQGEQQPPEQEHGTENETKDEVSATIT